MMNQTVAVGAQQSQVTRAHLLARLQAGEGPVMVAINDPEPAGAVVLRETEVAGFASQGAMFLQVALFGQFGAAAIPLADHVSAPKRSPLEPRFFALVLREQFLRGHCTCDDGPRSSNHLGDCYGIDDSVYIGLPDTTKHCRDRGVLAAVHVLKRPQVPRYTAWVTKRA